MKAQASIPFLTKLAPRRGFALVVTLCALVVLTVLILAFFSQALLNRQIAFSSTNLAKADYLARYSMDFVTSELRQEIRDGSDIVTGGSETSPPMFWPRTREDAAPRKVGVVNPDATVGKFTIAKVSAADQPVRPGGAITASDVALDARSPNGRLVSHERWFGSGGPGLGSQATMPTFFYVTRGNGVKTPALADAKSVTSNDYVIGRFGYTMYDVSGLLDANVVGHPTSAATAAAYKSSIAHADLAALDPGFTPESINAFIQWRNGAADTVNATAYEEFLSDFGGILGFFTVKKGHNAFLNRRDLKRAADQGLLPASALGYFSHRSRASDAPSWGPAFNSTELPGHLDSAPVTPIAYRDEANEEDSANRLVPNVRFDSAATITHYHDDGTVETYQVKPGDSLMQRRFSLTKLAWLTPDGTPPDGVTPQAIEDCFGLRWNSSDWCWDYVAAKSPPGVRIKTLAEVAEEEREPNFFELLSAGILKGSLGRDPGPSFEDADTDPLKSRWGVYASFFDVYKKEPNLQIFSIGANIIDQYDEDSYPTAIHFDAYGMTGADKLSIQTVYGIENLPYLHSLYPIGLADPVPTATTPGGVAVWMQPQLWNPHNVPQSSLPEYPTAFKTRAYGEAWVLWNARRKDSGGGGKIYAHPGPITDYDGEHQSLGEIYFVNPSDSASPFHDRPKLLTLNLTTGTGDSVVDTDRTPSSNYFDEEKWGDLPTDGGSTNRFAGFATVPDPEYDADPDIWLADHNLKPDVSKRLYYSLEYQAPDGSFHPYNFMARLSQPKSGKYYRAGDLSSPLGSTKINRGWGPIRADPRTDRFSTFSAWYGKQNRIGITSNAAPRSYTTPDGGGYGGPGDFGAPYLPGVFVYSPVFNPTVGGNASAEGILPGLWAINDMAHTFSSKQTYYTDPDGVVRHGDGYREYLPPTGNPTGDGNQLYVGTATVSPNSSITNPRTGSALRRRPVILNRAFRSVGEMGYAYRDQPFKSLDLWSPTSADAGLLDLFTVADGPTASAGRITPGNAPAPVLEALLSGTYKSESLNVVISQAERKTLAETIAEDSDDTDIANRADLAHKLGPLVSGATDDSAFKTSVVAESNWANKSFAEAPMRALVNVTDTRTWNLLIDVVAQTGRFPRHASSLQSFIPEGEKRYWLHIAIDRYTGKVVDRQLEPVYE